MAEYLEREGIKKSIKFFFDIRLKLTHSPIEIKQLVLDVIDGERAADVQPVRHGRWIPQGDDMWLCSNCKENKIFSMHESDRTEKQRYCCRCGARMEGGIDG